MDEWQINITNALLYNFRKPYYCRQLVVEFIHLREYEYVTCVLYTYVQLFTHEAVLLVQLIVSSKISQIGKLKHGLMAVAREARHKFLPNEGKVMLY